MTFNYNEFKKLTKNFKSIVNEYNEFLSNFLKEQGKLLLAKTKQTPRHPVDTGYLIGRWFMSEIYHINDKHYVHVYNSVNYASWVEDGHRTVNGGWVKGKHMARIALTEVELKLETRFNKEFDKWLKSKGL